MKVFGKLVKNYAKCSPTSITLERASHKDMATQTFPVLEIKEKQCHFILICFQLVYSLKNFCF